MKHASDFDCVCKGRVVLASKKWDMWVCLGCGRLYEEYGEPFTPPPDASMAQILKQTRLPAPLSVVIHVPELGRLIPVDDQ